jgi:putative oxidoreductase
MNTSRIHFGDYAMLALRLAIAFVFLYHGVEKAFNWGMATQMFSSLGFPGFLGPITGIAEVIAGALFVLGLYPRWSSLAFVVIIAAAITGIHLPASFAAGSPTPGRERDLLIIGGALVIMALGHGAIALGSRESTDSQVGEPRSTFE